MSQAEFIVVSKRAISKCELHIRDVKNKRVWKYNRLCNNRAWKVLQKLESACMLHVNPVGTPVKDNMLSMLL